MAAKRSLNLARMSLTELTELSHKIRAAIADKVAMERRDLQSKLAALDALAGGKGKRGATVGKQTVRANRRPKKPHPLKGKKAPAKYVGPGGETWSGRGLAPKWLAELERKGKKRESFLVK